MPHPSNAFKISGGCHCEAIRYTVSVPELQARSQTPYRTPGATAEDVGGDLRLPMVAIDHCNNCRRATGALLPMALITETTWSSVTCISKSNEGQNIELSAAELFDWETVKEKDVHLTVYKSTPQRSRWFCSRCGTNIAYTVDKGALPVEWGWPDMLDIWLGTVDREDLEGLGPPERMLWCENGIPWIRELARNGAGGVPEHPQWRIDELEKALSPGYP